MFALAALISLVLSVTGAIQTFVRWPSLRANVRTTLLVVSAGLLAVYALEIYSGWHTASWIFNEVQQWFTVGAYTLVVLVFGAARPKWLTRPLAAILLLAVPLAVLALVLGAMGDKKADLTATPIGNGLFFSRACFDPGAMGSSGCTIYLSYRPAKFPFLVRSGNSVRFLDRVCYARKAFALRHPDGHRVIARCPWYEYQKKSGNHDFVVPAF